MIIARLRGGLGNQMFQYAFGRTLSLRNSSRLALDLSYYAAEGSRPFALNEFSVVPHRTLTHAAAVRLRRIFGGYKHVPNLFFFDEKAAASTGNVYLDGYWESYKYFQGIEEFLKKEFALKRPSEAFKRLAAKIPRNSVSLHIRRGDYLTQSAAGKVLNGKGYAERALQAVLEKRGSAPASITIFSDDKEWCRRELAAISGIPAVVFDESVSIAEELTLMSLHRDNVISNSTFSWWAAFLNPAPDKIVVAPKDWLADPTMNAKYVADIVPAGWLVA